VLDRIQTAMAGVAALALVAAGSAAAAEYPASEAQAIDGKIACFAHHDRLVKTSSEPCNGFAPPAKLAIGESFTADGKRRTIGLIRATQAEEDMSGYGVEIKKGDWTCIAGETPADLDLENNRAALWLYVAKCKPMVQQAGMVQSVTAQEFLRLPQPMQAIYVGGLIEGMAFLAYGYSRETYPAWAECVRRKTVAETSKEVVALIGARPNFDQGVGTALAQVLAKRCGKSTP